MVKDKLLSFSLYLQDKDDPIRIYNGTYNLLLFGLKIVKIRL